MADQVEWDGFVSDVLDGIEAWGELSGDSFNAQAIEAAERKIAEHVFRLDRFSQLKEKALSARIRNAEVQKALEESWRGIQRQAANSLAESANELDKEVRLKSVLKALTKAAGFIGKVITVLDIEETFERGDPQELGLLVTQIIVGSMVGSAVVALAVAAIGEASLSVLAGAAVAVASVAAVMVADILIEEYVPADWQALIGDKIFDAYQYIEDKWADTFHTFENSEDTLAVEGLLWELDKDGRLHEMYMKDIFTAAADNKSEVLESLVNSLGDLFGVGEEVILHDRDSLHARLVALASKLLDENGDLKSEYGVLKLNYSWGSAAKFAKRLTSQGEAYRYALLHLNPFVIIGDESLYQDSELEIYDPINHTGSMSKDYIDDRAEFLVNLLNFRIWGPIKGNGLIEYWDRETGQSVTQFDMSDSDHISQRITFGSSGDDLGDDAIKGGADNDRLYGNDGIDWLIGNAGNDYLEGGKDYDTYIYSSGDGSDTILDTDGIGIIEYDGNVLTGGKEIGKGVYESSDGLYRFTLVEEGETTDLVINNGNITIKNYIDGALLITLKPADPYVPPSVDTQDIEGDHTPIEFEGGAWHIDALGNIVTNYGTNDPREDELYGSEESDHINGFLEHDFIDGKGGEDILIGGGGIDSVVGGSGNDELHGGDWIDIAALTTYEEYGGSEGTGLKGDWVTGGLGQDKVIGTAGDDVLFGGGDEDLLIGGPGDDILSGDDNYVTKTASWSVTPSDSIFHPIYHIDYIVDSAVEDGSGDVIYGGAGDDNISGQIGDDYLYGESGADVIAGGEHNDTIYGGDGDDTITGDYGANIRVADGGVVEQGDDFIFGGAGNDWLQGEEGDDHIYGGAGDDDLHGDASYLELARHGNDYLDGGEGRDVIFGYGGNDTIIGGMDDDDLIAGEGDDWVYGDGGSDYIWGGDGSDYIEGGEDDDLLRGEEGEDFIYGDEGNDQLIGSTGNDYLFGGADDDQLEGGSGDDYLEGGSGTDILDGGKGADSFGFNAGDGVDLVNNVDSGDKILLPGTGITATTATDMDGNDYLAIQYGADDLIYLEGGIATPVDHFEIGNGQVYDKGEFLSSALAGPVSCQMQDEGEAYGGSYDDTLVGSSGCDILHGQGGDDVLAGSAGDDQLYGGEGLDAYRIAVGTGMDRIYEEPDSTSRLELLSGISIDDLSYERQGNDLAIYIGDSRDGVTIENFFNLNQTWYITDKDGVVVVLDENGEPPESNTRLATSPEDAWQQFIERIQSAHENQLLASGYRLDDFGNLTGTDINGSSKKNYQVTFSIQEIDGVSGNYRCPNDNTEQQLVGTPYAEEITRSVHVPGPDALFARSGGQGTNYIPIDDGVLYDPEYQPGDVLVEVQGYNEYRDALTWELFREVDGYWIYPQGALIPDNQIETQTLTVYDYNLQINIPAITASAGDDRIYTDYGYHFASSLIDAGAGNDIIDATRELTYQGTRSPGWLLYGNDGDDQLYGSVFEDVLIGGQGHDILQGGSGSDTYYLFDYAAGDTIFDVPYKIDTHYYAEYGIDITELGGADDLLVLPEGVGFDDLTFEWGQSLAPVDYWSDNWYLLVAQSMHATLTLSWDGSEGVTIILPHSEDGGGFGIERVQVTTGESRFLSDLAVGAGAMPELDIHQQDNILSGYQVLSGAEGDDWLIADSDESYGHTLIGGLGSDRLEGSDREDTLIGGECVADDWFTEGPDQEGTLWDSGDTFSGGKGMDWMWASAGSDVFLYDLGDGQDLITDMLHRWASKLNEYSPDDYDWSTGIQGLDLWVEEEEHLSQLLNNHDTLVFGAGINPEDITVERGDNNLKFSHINGQDRVTFENWFYAGVVNQLNRVEFANGTVWDADDIESLINGETINEAPVVDVPLADQTIAGGEYFEFQIPVETFTDPDSGDSLVLSVTLSDDSPLPDWLQFNAATGMLSGTPDTAQVGTLDIKVIATDSEGDSGFDIFELVIEGGTQNEAPVVDVPIADQTITGGEYFEFQIPVETFTDPDSSDSLVLSVTLSDDSPLPDWLQFDAATGTLSGTPDTTLVGTLDIKVIATDSEGESVFDVFELVLAEPGTIIEGGSSNDVITGTGGNDIIIGGAGNDTLEGGAGDDTFVVEGTDQGYDLINGGEGFDTIQGGAGDDTIGLHHFQADDSVERIDGGTGHNTIAGGGGDNNTLDFSATELVGIAAIDGGWGNDIITGSSGNDTIIGGAGNDALEGGSGDDTFAVEGTNQGYDLVSGGEGFDTIQGGEGDDTIGLSQFSVDDGVERIDGGGGINTIAGGGGDNNTLDFSGTELLNIAAIDGGWGNDIITGSSGNDTIIGGAGNDTLEGGSGDDTFAVEGTNQGYDLVSGGEGFDTIQGGEGDDTIGLRGFSVDDGVERIDGGGGINTIAGGWGDNNTLDFSGTELVGIAAIDGRWGNDIITGSSGNDTIIGGAGNDTLGGGAGDDTIKGGINNDIVSGGQGSDVYKFAELDGVDVIYNYDYSSGRNDVLEFEDISYDRLWFTQSGNDLVIDVVGTNDKVTVDDWYLGENYQLDEITAGDLTLRQNHVVQLVNAMAVFDVPSGVGAVVPQDVQDQLTPVMASSWQ